MKLQKRRLPVLLLPVLLLLLLASCGKKTETTDPQLPPMPSEELIEEMYNHYIRGEYAVYVDQMQSLDNMPESYRKEMTSLMKQRHRAQIEDTGGPVSCRVIRTEASSDGKYIDVYLEITYKNHSFQQILFPLVFVNDQWRMK